MPQTALLLGSSGRFGRAMRDALLKAGWTVRGFDRKTDRLPDAAEGVDVIVNAWNPPYPDWQSQVPAQITAVLDAAQRHSCTVLMAGNVYVYGPKAPPLLTPTTPHAATNPLGRVRIDLEKRLAAAPVQTILLRAGDFLDTAPSGNWFDRIMIKDLAKGRFVYPGPLDRPHAFAFLPDMAEAAVALLQRRTTLGQHSDVPFAGYTLTGADLHQAVQTAWGQPLRLKAFPWPMLALAAPFSPMMRSLREMRYLWQMPHALDPAPLAGLIDTVPSTPLHEALKQAISHLK